MGAGGRPAGGRSPAILSPSNPLDFLRKSWAGAAPPDPISRPPQGGRDGRPPGAFGGLGLPPHSPPAAQRLGPPRPPHSRLDGCALAWLFRLFRGIFSTEGGGGGQREPARRAGRLVRLRATPRGGEPGAPRRGRVLSTPAGGGVAPALGRAKTPPFAPREELRKEMAKKPYESIPQSSDSAKPKLRRGYNGSSKNDLFLSFGRHTLAI